MVREKLRGLGAAAALACLLGSCAETAPVREKQPWDVKPAVERPPEVAAPKPAAPAAPAPAAAATARPGVPADPEKPVLTQAALQRINGLTAACDAKKKGTCVELGKAWLADADGVPRSPTRAATAFATGCRGKDGAACRRLQDMLDADDTTPTNLNPVFDAFKAACDAQIWDGCIGLAKLYGEGLGLAARPTSAAELLRRACEGGSPRGCHTFSFHLAVGWGVERDVQKARELEEQACTQKYQPACVAQGVRMLDDDDGEISAGNALDLFRAACKGGEQDGCLAQAFMFLQGIGVRENVGKAVTLLGDSCTSGYGASCLYLGHAQREGTDRPADPKLALKTYERGCALRNPESCLYAALELHKVEPASGLQGADRAPPKTGPEAGRARGYYEKACVLRAGEGCLAAATMYANGEPPPRDPKRATEYQKLACRYGAGEGSCDDGRRPDPRRLPRRR
jgi:TPR repeat protein